MQLVVRALDEIAIRETIKQDRKSGKDTSPCLRCCRGRFFIVVIVVKNRRTGTDEWSFLSSNSRIEKRISDGPTDASKNDWNGLSEMIGKILHTQ